MGGMSTPINRIPFSVAVPHWFLLRQCRNLMCASSSTMRYQRYCRKLAFNYVIISSMEAI